MVEYFTYNEKVKGSTPLLSNRFKNTRHFLKTKNQASFWFFDRLTDYYKCCLVDNLFVKNLLINILRFLFFLKDTYLTITKNIMKFYHYYKLLKLKKQGIKKIFMECTVLIGIKFRDTYKTYKYTIYCLIFIYAVCL